MNEKTFGLFMKINLFFRGFFKNCLGKIFLFLRLYPNFNLVLCEKVACETMKNS